MIVSEEREIERDLEAEYEAAQNLILQGNAAAATVDFVDEMAMAETHSADTGVFADFPKV